MGTRELWLAEKRSISLQKQLVKQETLVSQYKEEIENLEEQLRMSLERQHRAEDEKSLAERCCRHAWEENEKSSFSEGSTRAPSLQSTMRNQLNSSCGFGRPMSANRTSRTSTSYSNAGPQAESAGSAQRSSSRQAMAFEASSSEDEDPRCEASGPINRMSLPIESNR